MPDKLTEDDGLAVRMALLEIIKYYIQNDINITEVCNIVAYIASVNHEHLIVEMLELLVAQLNSKSCKDQLFLLINEPQTAELCYSLLTDRKYSSRLHALVISVSVLICGDGKRLVILILLFFQTIFSF